MATAGKHSRPWKNAVLVAVLLWVVGCYVPSISNAWAELNLIAPAGQRHLITLPLAFPGVGVDASTLCSLLGALIVVGAVVRWITYLQWDVPDQTSPVGLSPPPSNPPAT